MSLNSDQVPYGLYSAYKEGKCGIYVGAGLSMKAGLPSWRGLLLRLIDHGRNRNIRSSEKVQEYKQLADAPDKYLMLGEELREALGGSEFQVIVEEIFGDEAIRPTETHFNLVKLRNNRFIITTNYDMLIERAFAAPGRYLQGYKYYESHALVRDLFRRKFFLLKAHGDAHTSADQIVFTDKDYRRILYREPGYQSALQSIFTMYSVIFLGSSLQDPELRLLLNYINAAFPEGGTQHYALMTPESAGETERERWRKDYNMLIIPVSDEDGYADVDRFLGFLAESELAVSVGETNVGARTYKGDG